MGCIVEWLYKKSLTRNFSKYKLRQELAPAYICLCSRYTDGVIIISISRQMLFQRRKTGVWHSYRVSTACRGTGNIRDSLQTPLGKHRIYAKIGQNMPAQTAFSAREPVTIYNPKTCDPNRDWILSRILWLEGMQTGINKRGRVDTRSRYIYIHGTHEEDKIGQPASHGCIRMRNRDILELFEYAYKGEPVIIRKELLQSEKANRE